MVFQYGKGSGVKRVTIYGRDGSSLTFLFAHLSLPTQIMNFIFIWNLLVYLSLSDNFSCPVQDMKFDYRVLEDGQINSGRNQSNPRMSSYGI